MAFEALEASTVTSIGAVPGEEPVREELAVASEVDGPAVTLEGEECRVAALEGGEGGVVALEWGKEKQRRAESGFGSGEGGLTALEMVPARESVWE